MKRIVIFASGSGTNAENIIKFFNHTKTARVTQVLCNNEHAKVFDRCKKLDINCLHFTKKDFYTTDTVLNILKDTANFIILAGFLWRIPEKIIEAFPNKIINIHPALLPKYGGKGMYGMNVHRAVKANKASSSQIAAYNLAASHLKDLGAECLVLACTELSVIYDDLKTALPVFDASKILASSIIEEVLGPQ